MSINNLPHTILTDLDGVLVKHQGNIQKILNNPPELLPGVAEKLQEWNLKDYFVVITTGRRESMRQLTEQHLRQLGVSYDILIMGCRRGPRVVINDYKPDSIEPTAKSICIERNKGMKDLKI